MNKRCVFGAAALLTSAVWCADSLAESPGVVGTSQATLTADNPDFDGVAYTPLQCNPPGDPVGDESPSSIDLVGNATYAAAYYAFDSNYLYFRFRVNTDPSGPKGFAQFAWVALMQTPGGDPFQYQYELALNGGGANDDFGNTGSQKGDPVEIWQNTTAQDIDFSPIFNDPAEVRLYAQRYDYAGTSTVNTTPLARASLTMDGSNFGGNPDYFVEFAVPVQVLIAKGVIGSVADLASSTFFPATSANSNNYNKDHLDCPFLPGTGLSIDKTVFPTSVPANTTTQVTYTIVLTSLGPAAARGAVIEDTALPSYMANPSASCATCDPIFTCAVVTTDPLRVEAPSLPAGCSLTVTLTADVTPDCQSRPFTNVALGFASNGPEVSDSAGLQIGGAGTEICDGEDNDCDGLVDEESDLCMDDNACTSESCVSGRCVYDTVSCDDGAYCNGAETCDPASGCQPGTPPNCADAVSCTVDACDEGADRCTHTPTDSLCANGQYCDGAETCDPASGCQPGTPPNCADAVSCTVDACDEDADRCTHTPRNVLCDDGNPCTDGLCDGALGCIYANNLNPCNDANPCTTSDHCSSGQCLGGPPLDCDDGNPCTDDSCTRLEGCVYENNLLPCDDGDPCTDPDVCANGVCGCGVFGPCGGDTITFENTTPLTISSGAPSVVTSDLGVSGAGVYLLRVRLTTSILHAHSADLDVTLTSPAGTVVTITSDNGGPWSDVFGGTLWDDRADPGSPIPYAGNPGLVTDHAFAADGPVPALVPEEALGAVEGENPNGTWRLRVSDDSAGAGGTLTGWTLEVTSLPGPPLEELRTFANSDPVSIQDNASAPTASTVEATGAGERIGKVRLRTFIRHATPGDLEMTLESPEGTIVTILSRPPSVGADTAFNGTTWADDVDPGNQVPFPGDVFASSRVVTDTTFPSGVVKTVLVPEEAMAAFTGEDPAGEWVLSVRDAASGGTGTLDHWSLEIITYRCRGSCETDCNQPGTCTPPGEVPGLRFGADKVTLEWDPSGGPGAAYDTVRGAIGEWPVGAGARETCAGSGSGTTAVSDGALPGGTEGFWYLVRARDSCGAGPYGYAVRGGVPDTVRATAVCP